MNDGPNNISPYEVRCTKLADVTNKRFSPRSSERAIPEPYIPTVTIRFKLVFKLQASSLNILNIQYSMSTYQLLTHSLAAPL